MSKQTLWVKVAKWRGEPPREGFIEVTIDVDSVARQLATKAFFSKGRKSRVMGGAITGKVLGTLTDSPAK